MNKEISAEMLLGHLYPELELLWTVRHRGTFYRNYSPDVMDILQAHTVASDFAPAIVPRHHRLRLGDVIRLDGGPIYCGYGADLARTFVLGNSTDKRREEISGYKSFQAWRATHDDFPVMEEDDEELPF